MATATDTTNRRRGRRVLIALATAVALAVPASAGAAEGDVSFMRNATSSFDKVLTSSSSSEQRWMQQHYDRVRAYPPFFDRFLEWAPETEFYIDAYAIYSDEGSYPGPDIIRDHPSWVLKDSSGHNLFIPYGCSGGTCPQYAADFGNPAWRTYFIGLIEEQVAKGYSGVHIDDVNLEMRAGDGNGESVRPIDPRTGAPMTDSNWARYMADFMAEVKAALPGVQISHNSLWFMSHSDPSVQRETDSADVIEMERGFNDQGLTGGRDRFSYAAYLDHVDWLHSRGKSVTFEPYDLTARSASFEVASYMLVKEDGDMITSDYHSTPNDWWKGWDVDLGAATGPRYGWQGVIRRDFANGVALVNGPDEKPTTVTINGSWTDLDGNPVDGEIRLGPREGIVLQGAGGLTGSTAKITLKSSKSRVERGKRLKVRGKGGLPGDSVELEYRSGAGWKTFAQSDVSESGRFSAKLRAARLGRLRLRAASPDNRRSRVVKVRVLRDA